MNAFSWPMKAKLLVAVVAASVGVGIGLPAGSAAQADDSCMWARNGSCDEPHACAYGTDYTDCSPNP
jgi:hypothetical protein